MSAILVAGPAFAAGAVALGTFTSLHVAAWLGPPLAAAGLLAAVAVGSTRPGWQWFGPALTRARTGRPEVALTFDDGPDPASTPALLAALADAGARATFYLLADRAQRHPTLARAIAAQHEIGLHGASHHPWLTVRAPATGAAELREAADALHAITGVRPTTFRPPFGVTSPRLAEAARRAGLQVAWCSLRTGDGVAVAPDALRARCRSAVAGDVLLLHEGPRAAREALPGILADLTARGLKPVTVRELFA